MSPDSPASSGARTSEPDLSHLEDSSSSRLAGNTLIMAAGTIVSRFSGFLRSMLLVAALGVSAHADIFSIANTVPTMVYILVAGGVFNAVLVPQLVRAMKNDADRGDGYAQRLITLAMLFLSAVTIVLIIAAPWLMDLVLADSWREPEMAQQRQSLIDFTRYCMPQVFFYGMFVLVGQILNARGRFGPMMWAPIANNLISLAVLGIYLVSFGSVSAAEANSAYSTQQELFLGLGSTLGIAVQFLVLLPYLYGAGFRFRLRFDFRDSGLGHTLRLGAWTLMFVIVNQIAYVIVTKLASTGSNAGSGATIYQNSFLIMMVPHSIITVSLATALLPRLSALAEEQRLSELGLTLGRSLRTALVVVLPFVVLLPVVAPDMAKVLWNFGAGKGDTAAFVPALMMFAPGLLFFTVHYLMLRGFYALERTKQVFFIQVVVSIVNIAAAVYLVAHGGVGQTAPRLAAAYGIAYAVGALISYLILQRVLGTLDTTRTVRFLVRMVLALAAGAVVALAAAYLLSGFGTERSWLIPILRGAVVGLVGLLVTVVMAYGLRIREVTSLIQGARRVVASRVLRR